MRILFITRKYPPAVGGMETAAHSLYKSFERSGVWVDLIKYGGSNKFLPLVYPWLVIKALAHISGRRYDAIYLQDGLLAFLGAIIGRLSRTPTIITIHGLEVSYSSFIYRKIAWPLILRPSLDSCSQIVAVSKSTQNELKKHLPKSKSVVISNGVNDEFYLKASREKLWEELVKENAIAKEWKNKKVILTVGRLVKRKGVAWFVDNVMPTLVRKHPGIVYLITSDGPERHKIEQLIEQHNLESSVKLLGLVSAREKQLLYNLADVFVMPNIPVINDLEGFGLVAVEASSCGTPVVGSNIEGIPDAIIDKKTGLLSKSQNTEDFNDKISQVLSTGFDREQVRLTTLQNYSWSTVADMYVKLMSKLSK